MVECTPISSKAASKIHTDEIEKPSSPSPMIPISAALTMRISRPLSTTSAICPASAESRKNGRISTPSVIGPSIAGLIGEAWPRP